jgi:hypothetical protein
MEARINNSPPGTGGVARSAGVLDKSKNFPPVFHDSDHCYQEELFPLHYHPGPSGHPSCSRRGVVTPPPYLFADLADEGAQGLRHLAKIGCPHEGGRDGLGSILSEQLCSGGP